MSLNSIYEIRLDDHLGKQWEECLGQAVIINHKSHGKGAAAYFHGTTVLIYIQDQSELMSVLSKVNDLGLKILSIFKIN